MKAAEEFKGTTSEWKIQEPYNTFVYGSEGKLICQMKYDPFSEESIANAQLIAAAPELLKELIDFCKTFESTIGYQGYDHNVFVALNDRYIKSKKAIKKALGL